MIPPSEKLFDQSTFPVVQRADAFEGAYITLLADLMMLAASKQYVTSEELKALLASGKPPVKPEPPACNCGHEFSKDPKWWHLAYCEYRAFYGD